MSDSFRGLDERLEKTLPDNTREELARDPVAAIERLGIRVVTLSTPFPSDECGCDGVYFPEPRPTIAYTPTQRSRRENFTLLHELGHHLIRRDDDVNSDLADLDEEDGADAEEKLCDAFAGRTLVPDRVVAEILMGRSPEASDLDRLFENSIGSREACAIRLAERMPCFGYVAILDPAQHKVRFASASPHCGYRWRRGSDLPSGHPVWNAVNSVKGFRGEGEVVWERHRKNIWLDAVASGPVVIAIFSEDRYWKADGLNLLSGTSAAPARSISMSGTCKHCGADTWGNRACNICGDVKCRSCGRCGCGARERLTLVCSRCRLTKASTQFPAGSTTCRDCQ